MSHVCAPHPVPGEDTLVDSRYLVSTGLFKSREADRDAWIAERDAEYLSELCGTAAQRRNARSRCGSKEYALKVKAYLKEQGRNPEGPDMPQANVPKPSAKVKRATSDKRSAEPALMGLLEMLSDALFEVEPMREAA